MNIWQDRCRMLSRCGAMKGMCVNPKKKPKGIFSMTGVSNWFERVNQCLTSGPKNFIKSNFTWVEK